MEEELERIEKRLQQLRDEWSKEPSLAKRKFIVAGANLLIDRRTYLVGKIAREEFEKNGAGPLNLPIDK